MRNALRTLRARLDIRKVAMLRDLPRLRWRPGDTYPLVNPELRQRAGGLESEFEVLDRELLPTFKELDRTALRSQNYFRLGQLLLIVGGLLATALGALQTALGAGVVWIAIVGAVVSGGLSGIVFYMRGRNLQRDYFSARLKAELLRGEYFVFLGRVDPYTAQEPEERERELRQRVAEIESAESTV